MQSITYVNCCTMEAPTNIRKRSASTCLLDFQKFDYDKKGEHRMRATAFNSSPNAMSNDTCQKIHAARNSIRHLAGEQRRAVAISQPNTTYLVKCESNGNDQLKGVDTKQHEKNERKTRSSTDKLLLCPFSNTRVYAILNGDIQFVSLIPTRPFVESIHAVSSISKVLESPHKHAAIDRRQANHLDSNRNGLSQSLHSFVNHGSSQSRNERIGVTSNGKDREGKKCSPFDDEKHLTTDSFQCTMSDTASEFVKCESNGYDQLKSVDTKQHEENERKTRSSTDKLLLCPFSDTRVYAILNGDIQFVSLIPTTPFLESVHAVSSSCQVLESCHEHAAFDRHQMNILDSNRNGLSQSLRSFVNRDSRQSRNERIGVTSKGTDREGKKCSPFDDEIRLTTESFQCTMSDDASGFVKCESNGNDQLKGVDTKQHEKNERKTRSSTDKLLLCPFSNTRVYAILNGDIQFVSLIPTRPFVESIHAVSSISKVLESPHKRAAIDRRQANHLDSNRNGLSQSLHSFVNHGSSQSRNERIGVTSNGKDREGKKCSPFDDEKRLTTESFQCPMSDNVSGDQTGSNDAVVANFVNSYDDGHLIKRIDSTPLVNKPEPYLSRLRTRLPRLTKPLKATGNDEDLDNTTLGLLFKVALKDLIKCHKNKVCRFCCEHLDEEEIESFMLRTTRAANDRVNHALVLRVDDSSNDYNRDAIMFLACLAEAEGVIVWQDYFQRIVRETKRYVIHHHVKDVEGTKFFDKRTINCTKRRVATYLRWNREIEARKQPGNRHIANNFTRNSVSNRVLNKKQSRDDLLEIIFQAVEIILPEKEETRVEEGNSHVEYN